MTLKIKIDEAIKTAMRAKDQDALRALRGIKSMILLAETAEGHAGGDISSEEEIKLLTKAMKQRRESASIFKEQNRTDLYEKEMAEIAIIEPFLPAQLSDEALQAQIKEMIAEVGATSIKDMRKVMDVANKRLAGQAEAQKIAGAVKLLLS